MQAGHGGDAVWRGHYHRFRNNALNGMAVAASPLFINVTANTMS